MKRIASFILLAVLVCGINNAAQAQVTVRANALGYAGLVPNLGFEFGLSKHFTFVAEGYYSPFWDESGFRAKGWLVTPEFRYYFCQKFNKHYIGIHGNYADFDKFQITKKQNVRDGYAYGAGLTYGHTWKFNHRWSFDLFIGGGWWHLKSDVYCKNDPNVLIETNKEEDRFGLSRLGATFAYRF